MVLCIRLNHHHAQGRTRASLIRSPARAGINFIANSRSDSFAVDVLTDIFEQAVYKAFEALSEREGVLGAVDTLVQRGKIQETCMVYEHKKHDGSLPWAGVNMLMPKEGGGEVATEIELIRSIEQEGPADRELPQLAARPQRPRAEGRDCNDPVISCSGATF